MWPLIGVNGAELYDEECTETINNSETESSGLHTPVTSFILVITAQFNIFSLFINIYRQHVFSEKKASTDHVVNNVTAITFLDITF